MWSAFLGALLLVYFPDRLDSCAATSSTSSTVTTTTSSSDSGTTTTVSGQTTTTTTTTTALACSDCTLTNPAIEHLKVQAGAVDITSDTVSIDSTTGCAIRTIMCVGSGAGATVFISWNNEAAGTTQGVAGANTVTGTLMCSPDGTTWLLVANGVPITQAECDST